MKTFNRLVTVVLLVLLLVLLPIVATVPDAVLNAIQSAQSAVEPWVMTTMGRVVTGVVAALLWLLVIWVLWREVHQGGDRSIRVAEVEEGRARVAEASVAKLLESRVSAVPDVKAVSAKVRQSDKEGVMVELSLTTTGEVRIPDVTRMAIETVRQTLETEIGAKVGRVDVRVKEVGRAEGTVMAPVAAAVDPGQTEAPAWTAPEPATPSWAEPRPEPVVMPEEEPTWQASEPVESEPEWAATVAEEQPAAEAVVQPYDPYYRAADEASEPVEESTVAEDALMTPVDSVDAVTEYEPPASTPLEWTAEGLQEEDARPEWETGAGGLSATYPSETGDSVEAEVEATWDECRPDDEEDLPEEGAAGQA